MMAMRSHRMSASSMLCVVSTIARSALCRRMMSQVNLQPQVALLMTQHKQRQHHSNNAAAWLLQHGDGPPDVPCCTMNAP